MPRQLLAYASQVMGPSQAPEFPRNPHSAAGLNTVFVLLRARTGHDFSQYKPRTIHRRMERRMAVHQIAELAEYAHFLEQHPDEITALFADLLIGVTGFFRDSEVFVALQAELALRLLADRPAELPVRVWVPGCSTGEEAYSLAILLYEQMLAVGRIFKVHIFATDIDGAAIAFARAGVYAEQAVADISPERLARFFTREPDRAHYRIHKFLREMLVFSEQDVIKDPPFSRLDLISCRNLLIYLGLDLQRRLLPLFHYALNPGGLLLLGASESVGNSGDYFRPLQPKAKLYVRKDDAATAWRRPTGLMFPAMMGHRLPVAPAEPHAGARKSPVRELTERPLLQYYTPAAALVNGQGEILCLHGRTGRFLELAPGESSLNILKMARDGLSRELRLALTQAVASRKPARFPDLKVRTNGDFSRVDLTVRPVTADLDPPSGAELFLVVLEEPVVVERAPVAVTAQQPAAAANPETTAEMGALQHELQSQTEALKRTAAHLELSNEDLRAVNEELQSLNEELQAVNEELETSKEELQAVNEELATVNEELQQRVAELSRSNNDLNNLMAGTGVGTIFVDHALCIQRFTPAATAIIHLIPSDIGRPIGNLVATLVDYDRLVADVRHVLDTLVPAEIEVHSPDAWYLLRIRPYRTLENVIEGAVITFTDITELKRSQDALRRLAVVVQDARDAVLVHDLTGKILAWNTAATRLYGWSEPEALALTLADVTPVDHQPQAAAVVQRLRRGEAIGAQPTQRLTKEGQTLEVQAHATALVDATGNVYGISLTEWPSHG